MTQTPNLLITGTPRSGTTLLTATIHAIPNYVALSEPVQQQELKKDLASPEQYAKRLMALMQTLRQQILAGVALPNRFDKGGSAVASNYWKKSPGAAGGGMEATAEIREEVLAVQNENFTLGVKNCEQFTVCLEALVKLPQAPIIAVIRNPVACLLSWRSLDLPVSHGRLKFGEKFHRELRRIKRIDDLLLRQVKLLDWYLERFYRHRESVRIMRYEDFVANPDLLRELIPVPVEHIFPGRQSMNERPEYNLEETDAIRDCLREHAPFARLFYPSF